MKDLQAYLGMEGADRDGKLGADTEKKMMDYANAHHLDTKDPAKLVDEVIQAAKQERTQNAETAKGHDTNLAPPPLPGKAAGQNQAAAR